MKKRLIIWIIVAVILISGLTVLGFAIKKKNAPYNALEKELENKAIALIGEKPSLINSTSKLTILDLENNNYKIELKVNDDLCSDGYIIVSKEMGFYKYKGYIKCHNYTTHGYKK